MTDTRKSTASKTSRPKKSESRTEEARPAREYLSMADFRNKLTVLGKDPDYEYRFFRDKSESGVRIWAAQQVGWEFADAEKEGLKVGELSLMHSEGIGTLVRIPANREGEYLYLMKMPREMFEESIKHKAKEVDELEAQINRHRDPDLEDGQYGSVRIDHVLGQRRTTF